MQLKEIKLLFCTLVLSICCVLNVSSQSMAEPEWAVFGSFLYGGINNKSYNNFTETYAAAYPNLEKPFTDFRGSGFTCGIRGIVAVSYMRFSGVSEGTYKNGNIMRVKNTITAPIIIGFPFIVSKLYVHPKIGFANTRLDISTEYPNGLESFGKDGEYNGQFNSNGFYYALDLAFTQRIGKKSRLEIGANYTWIVGNKTWFSDHSYGKILPTEKYPMTIPQDVVTYNSGYEYDYGKEYVNATSSMLSFYITYAFILHKQD